MSHVAAVDDLVITDECLDVAEQVLARCGCELVRGQTTHRWYGQFLNDWQDSEGRKRGAIFKGYDAKTFGKCLHAIRVKGDPDAYEVGLVARPDGKPGYSLVYDAFGGGGQAIERRLGTDLRGFREEFSTALARRHAVRLAKQGYRVKETMNAQGERQIVAVRG